MTSGDQFDFRSKFGEDFDVELARIDAPRGKGALARHSRESLHAIAAGYSVTLTIQQREGDSLIADASKGTADLARTQLGRGWAEVTRDAFGRADPVLLEAEELARRRGLGLWGTD